MSFCDEIDDKGRCFSVNCSGNNCTSGKSGCEAHISSCNCQSNVGCLDRGACSDLRPTGTAATGACPGPCQCVEEDIWNSNVPPKPNCRWLSNFAELRRQWSNHGRQQALYKCRPCRTVASSRSWLSPTTPCSGTIFLTSDCQRCCGSRRLAGGASKSEMAPADKSSSSEALKREAGGGCPPPNCSHPSTRCNVPSADCPSSCCPSQCGHPQASSHRAPDYQPCDLRSILRKRSCCQCNATRCCLCQPMPRGCNCPPPVRVDVRATRECSCDCPSSPECACPPSERRFPRVTWAKCPNARPCCPSPRLRLPPSPKCCCPRCQPCPPSPRDPCTSSKCRQPLPPLPPKNPCSPCPSSCPPGRPPTPRRKLTPCTDRSDRPFSPCTGQSREIIGEDEDSGSSIGKQNDGDERRELHNEKDRDCRYAEDYCCAGSEIRSDGNRDLTLNEGHTRNSRSKTFINLSEITSPSKSVDPDSHGTSEERDEAAFRSAAEALEECTIEKSSKDSWYTSSTRAPCDSGAEPDCSAFHEEYPPTSRNTSGNLVLAKLSGASISSLTTTPTRGIDRQRRNGESLREDTAESLPRGKSRVSCITSEETSSSAYAQENEKKSASACYDVFSNLGGIGYSTLVPSPLALISFALLILIALIWSSGSACRYLLRKRICWKYLSL